LGFWFHGRGAGGVCAEEASEKRAALSNSEKNLEIVGFIMCGIQYSVQRGCNRYAGLGASASPTSPRKKRGEIWGTL
jgi:hypothetical protein